MSEMVERVAKAMEERATRGLAMPPWREIARAAIEAMREPTGKMLDMGQHFYDKTECGLMDIGPASALNEAWDRMISVALE